MQGHVDGVGRLQTLEPTQLEVITGDWWMRFSIPEDCLRYVVDKGSITVEGISLTVAKIEGNIVTVNLIPHTYSATNLHTLQAESPVNIEVDVLAKYAEQRMATKISARALTLESLIANGY